MVWVASKHVGHCSLRKQRVGEEAGAGYWTKLSQSPRRLDPLIFWHWDQRQNLPVIQRVANILWHQHGLPGSLFGLKDNFETSGSGYLVLKSAFASHFCWFCICKYLDGSFPGEMIDIGCSAWECHPWTANASGCQSCSHGVTAASCVDMH